MSQKKGLGNNVCSSVKGNKNEAKQQKLRRRKNYNVAQLSMNTNHCLFNRSFDESSQRNVNEFFLTSNNQISIS